MPATATAATAATAETRPLPGVTAPAPPAPCCGWCGGAGVVWDDDFGEVGCVNCDATGAGDWVAPCELELAPTHTHKKPGARRAVYDPRVQRLRVIQGKKFETYTVFEFPGDSVSGPCFHLVKLAEDGKPEEDETGNPVVYDLSAGRPSCDCPGFTYEASRKADRRAFEAGGDLYGGFGCKHVDAMVPLLKAGWFDLQAGPG